MNFEITILGCSSAVPTAKRWLSSQWLTVHHRHYLLDCGEGTQIRIRQEKLPMQRLQCLMISHAHADHFLGLPGLLSTMDLLDRRQPLRLFAPKVVLDFLDHYISITGNTFRFELERHVLEPDFEGLLFEDKGLQCYAVPLTHPVPCHGFLFYEKVGGRKLKKDWVEAHHPGIQALKQLKRGKDVCLEDGTVILSDEVTDPPPKVRSYGYLTDTRPRLDRVNKYDAVDILYHEATFMELHKSRAKKTGHSTAKEAAELARQWGVTSLLLGHFSVRYRNLTPVLEEAKSIFKDCHLAENGYRIILPQTT